MTARVSCCSVAPVQCERVPCVSQSAPLEQVTNPKPGGIPMEFQKSVAEGIVLNIFLTDGVKFVIHYFVNNMISTSSHQV